MSEASGGPHESGPADRHDRVEIEQLLRDELAPRIEVVRWIGDETFGSLYLAREPTLDRQVVVKVLRSDYQASPEARLRFAREARAAAKMSHPNAVEVFRTDLLSVGIPYLIQPYLGECTLAERLRARSRFEAERVGEILADLASALSLAHRKGFVHRDVRPETVRCQDEPERVLLTDFGLAGVLESSGFQREKITWSGTILRSLGVMSPEQMRGLPVTDRADVYGLGALGWRLLVGAEAMLPSPEARTTTYWRSLGKEVGDPELVDLIRRCMAESPMDRPSAGDVVDEIASMRKHHAVVPPNPISDLIERRIPYVGLFLVTVVSLLGVVTDVQELSTRPLLLLGAFTVAGFMAILVGTWYHGKKGAQEIESRERWLYGLIAGAWLLISALIWTLTRN